MWKDLLGYQLICTKVTKTYDVGLIQNATRRMLKRLLDTLINVLSTC